MTELTDLHIDGKKENETTVSHVSKMYCICMMLLRDYDHICHLVSIYLLVTDSVKVLAVGVAVFVAIVYVVVTVTGQENA